MNAHFEIFVCVSPGIFQATRPRSSGRELVPCAAFAMNARFEIFVCVSPGIFQATRPRSSGWELVVCRYLAKFSSLDHAALDSSLIWTQTNARVWYSNPATSCCHSECVSNAVWVQKWRIHNGKIHCARPANVMDPYLCESVHNSDGCLRYANTNRKTWTWHFLDVTSSLLNHLPITDLITRGVRYLIFVSR